MAAKVALVVNAGGESRRMGRTKALLPVPPHGRPLITHLIDRLVALSPDPIVVVTSDAGVRAAIGQGVPVRFVEDRMRGVGPLAGLAAGLDAVAGWAAVVACDLPLVQPAIFGMLLKLAEEQTPQDTDCWDAVVPVVDGHVQVLHALIHRRCSPWIEARLLSGERRMQSFLDDVRVRWVREDEVRAVDGDLRSFRNVNTPEEWAAVCRLLQAGKQESP